jgi:Rrf2 family protein
MISTRARFALHGLCYLAKRPAGEPTSFSQLFAYLEAWSSRLTLSRGYVSKIFQDLSRAGLVRAVPGRKGGYRLARPPREMTLMDVMRVVERIPVSECCLLADGSCAQQDLCGIVAVIEEAHRAFFQVLSGETIESLARRMPLPPPVASPRRTKTARR